jgi:hypothetical protein
MLELGEGKIKQFREFILEKQRLEESFKSFETFTLNVSKGYKKVKEDVLMIQVLEGFNLSSLLNQARKTLLVSDVRFAILWDTMFSRGMLLVWNANIAHEFMLKAIDEENVFNLKQSISKLYVFSYDQATRLEQGKKLDSSLEKVRGLILLTGVFASGILYSTIPKEVIELFFGSLEDNESLGNVLIPHDYKEILTNKEKI